MQLNFLELARTITIEVASGRTTASRGKEMLKINSDIVVNEMVRDRLKLWENVVKHRNIALDYPGEEVPLYDIEGNSFGDVG